MPRMASGGCQEIDIPAEYLAEAQRLLEHMVEDRGMRPTMH